MKVQLHVSFVGLVLLIRICCVAMVCFAMVENLHADEPALASQKPTAAAPDALVGLASNTLRDYITKVDATYGWKKVREGSLGEVEYVELILTSQTWQKVAWKHRLFILRPTNMKPTKQGIFVVAGGHWRDKYENPEYKDNRIERAAKFAPLVREFQSPVAVLMNVPHQPIFGGMREDRIISYTFEKYLDTQDPQWPALLPMVKSAVRGMDAVQEFAEQEWDLKIDSFTVAGASKRGWVTWLVGATDKRVTAIAPMVIEILNMGPQMEHQLEAWGKFSEQIKDYTERNITQRMSSPVGQKLARIIDPLAYRESLTLPKLIMIGTNDRYWPLDAANLYWQHLAGPKYLLYIPNNGHGLTDFSRILGTFAALHAHARGGKKLPQLKWNFSQADEELNLKISSDKKPSKVRVWRAESPTRDFREAHWMPTDVEPNDDAYSHQVAKPKKGFAAVFGEAVYPGKIFPCYLSTNVRIIESENSAGGE